MFSAACIIFHYIPNHEELTCKKNKQKRQTITLRSDNMQKRDVFVEGKTAKYNYTWTHGVFNTAEYTEYTVCV